jgi:hypothetical protein
MSDKLIIEIPIDSGENLLDNRTTALNLLEEFKIAVQYKDKTAIDNVCNFLKRETKDSVLNIPVINACDNLFSNKKCEKTVINYITPLTENYDIKDSFLIIQNSDGGNCGQADIYVDEFFNGFSDEELEYISNLHLTYVKIIQTGTNSELYSGLVNSNIQDILGDNSSNDGWIIIIGIILFISMGLLARKSIR